MHSGSPAVGPFATLPPVDIGEVVEDQGEESYSTFATEVKIISTTSPADVSNGVGSTAHPSGRSEDDFREVLGTGEEVSSDSGASQTRGEDFQDAWGGKGGLGDGPYRRKAGGLWRESGEPWGNVHRRKKQRQPRAADGFDPSTDPSTDPSSSRSASADDAPPPHKGMGVRGLRQGRALAEAGADCCPRIPLKEDQDVAWVNRTQPTLPLAFHMATDDGGGYGMSGKRRRRLSAPTGDRPSVAASSGARFIVSGAGNGGGSWAMGGGRGGHHLREGRGRANVRKVLEEQLQHTLMQILTLGPEAPVTTARGVRQRDRLDECGQKRLYWHATGDGIDRREPLSAQIRDGGEQQQQQQQQLKGYFDGKPVVIRAVCISNRGPHPPSHQNVKATGKDHLLMGRAGRGGGGGSQARVNGEEVQHMWGVEGEAVHSPSQFSHGGGKGRGGGRAVARAAPGEGLADHDAAGGRRRSRVVKFYQVGVCFDGLGAIY